MRWDRSGWVALILAEAREHADAAAGCPYTACSTTNHVLVLPCLYCVIRFTRMVAPRHVQWAGATRHASAHTAVHKEACSL